jgi:DNA-binding SARP family transcriptional activator/tetratricopeptide (TPR) repeat protein
MAAHGASLGAGRDNRRIRIELAGGCLVAVDGRPLAPTELGSRRGRMLLEMLAAARGRALTCDEIVEVLWPTAPPRRPEAAVATLVSRLRSVLGPEAVLGARGSYRQGMAPQVEVDLDEAATFVVEAEQRLPAEPAVAATAAQRALHLLARPALENRRYDSWAQAARDEQTELARRARAVATKAALDVGDARAAVTSALVRVADDPLDEAAHRDLMRAHQLAGSPGLALEAYTRLRERLAAELGIDPSAQTQEVYLAVLRGVEDRPADSRGIVRTAPRTPASHALSRAEPPGLTGRAHEVARLRDTWTRTVTGEGRDQVTVLLGEAGIGKTRLAAEVVDAARRTGATVLQARCYESERSLFLQPVVDAITPTLAATPPSTVAAWCGGDAPVLASVLPVVGTILDVAPDESGTEGLRRRRAFEVLCALVTRMSAQAPVLLFLDDVHEAGRSTLELAAYLVRHRASARFMVLTAARWEARDGLRSVLGPTLDETDVGPLDREAVRALATAAGRAELTDTILHRTNGHTLYVVEVLAALEHGDGDIPQSLRSAVLDRVRRAGAEVEALLRAAAVLGSTVDPSLLARLTGLDQEPVLRACEQALQARLLAVAGREYEFSHDVVREVLYAATPEPTRVAHHRRAADLLGDRPEAVAAHAAAAQDWSRAARAGLVAAENALRSLAAKDAEVLATRALGWATTADAPELRARALLLRAAAREVSAGYAGAMDDLQGSLAIARSAGDQRLEMLVLRQLGGDVSSALGVHVTAYADHLDAALRLAETLGDHTMEADLLGRMTVLHVNRLRFRAAIACADRARAAAQASRDEHAIVLALDAAKSAYAYLGETTRLRETTSQLEPLLRRRSDMRLLQWTVFESAFVPLAAGRHDQARTLMEEALTITRRAGFLGYQSWFLAHLAWEARLCGDVPRAVRLGERSIRSADELTHAWWHSAALAMHAVTLLEAGDTPTATALLQRALPESDEAGTEAYRLRCLSALAQATGSLTLLREADELVRTIECPAGSAWLLGADTYLCTARAWLARGDVGHAADLLVPFRHAARRCGWGPLLEQAAPVVRRLPAATSLQP